MRYVLAAFCTLLILLALVIQVSAQTNNWAAGGRRYRIPVTVTSGQNELTDKVIDVPVNFAGALTTLGASGAVNESSIVVTETDAQGTITDPNVVYQLETGKILIFAKGVTAAGATRRFYVYFDTGASFTKPAFTPLVSFQDNVQNQGAPNVKITTPNGIYFFDKPGGGIASIFDADNKDWVTFSTKPGQQGMYHGIPNVIEPEGGFHPGDPTMVSTIGASGPLKLTIESHKNDNKWEGTYEFYPTYAKFTLTKSGHGYWLLYEGTPGGALETATDYNVRSNGTKSMASQSWDADIAAPEWIYFADGTINRSLFMYHLDDDNNTDQYWPMGSDMTVFGFGRPQFMSALPGRLVFGLINTREHAPAKKLIEGAGATPTATAGAPEKNDNAPTVGPTIAPTNPPGGTCLATKPQGDADCNGSISITDYAMWKNEFRGAATTKNGDFNATGSVTLADYQIWRTNFR